MLLGSRLDIKNDFKNCIEALFKKKVKTCSSRCEFIGDHIIELRYRDHFIDC
jgi:hypothetical protein